MLTITDSRRLTSCLGSTRRESLCIGGMGRGSLRMPALLAVKQQAGFIHDRAVLLLLLFLQGGPYHTKFFDPKIKAPPEIRNISGDCKTR